MQMENPKHQSNAGDILWGKNNRNKYNIPSHYIIYLGPGENEDTFEGSMLTHSKADKHGNIPMLSNHFEKVDSNGNEFKFQFDQTLLSPARYHKRLDWKPFTIAGKLTEEGLKFVLSKIPKLAEHFRFNKD